MTTMRSVVSSILLALASGCFTKPDRLIGAIPEAGMTSVRGLAIGRGHACAILPDGSLWCWGENAFGELGVGTLTASTVPVRVGTKTDWMSIGCGDGFSCGLDSAAKVWCWGDSSGERLGEVMLPIQTSPREIAAAAGASMLSVGRGSACTVDAGGSRRCWGGNVSGRLGLGTNTASEPVTQAADGRVWRSVSSGNQHGCAIEDATGRAWCWGRDNSGQLGDGSPLTDQLSPVAVASARTWTAVATSGMEDHSCAIQMGELWCWGLNGQGQIDGTLGSYNTPIRIASGQSWTAVTPGGRHTCAIDSQQQLSCWGDNIVGQLGDGTTIDHSMPGPVAPNGLWTLVATGDVNSCGARVDGSVWCWGSNELGTVGNGVAGTGLKETAPIQLSFQR